MSLEQAAKLSDAPETRFAALVHDLGKALTPEKYWPSHRGHEVKGLPLIDRLCERCAVPKRFRELARHVAQFHLHIHKAMELRPDTVLRVLESVSAFRKPDSFEQFLLGCEADARGRTGLEDDPYPQAQRMRDYYEAANAISAADVGAGIKGKAIGEEMKVLRIAAIAAIKKS